MDADDERITRVERGSELCVTVTLFAIPLLQLYYGAAYWDGVCSGDNNRYMDLPQWLVMSAVINVVVLIVRLALVAAAETYAIYVQPWVRAVSTLIFLLGIGVNVFGAWQLAQAERTLCPLDVWNVTYAVVLLGFVSIGSHMGFRSGIVVGRRIGPAVSSS